MGWQFLSDDDRRQLTGELAELEMIQLGATSRTALLDQAGLADFNSQLNSLANSAAQVFAAELVSKLENETTLPQQSDHQALGLLLNYALSLSDTPQSTRAVCARLIGRYRLIDDEEQLSRLAADYGQPEAITPWRDSRREIVTRRSPNEQLTQLMLVAVVGALALLVAVVIVNQQQREETGIQPTVAPTTGPIVTDYHVSLTLSEDCPAEWSETLATRIKENVDAATPTRPVVYVAPEEADLVLTLACGAEDVAWTAQWTDPAPIFNIVGSPQKVEITLPLSLADSELLGRALISYGQNNFNSARNVLTQLVNRVDAPLLQLLYANTLLLTEEYADTVDAYSRLINDPESESDLLALAYNNRGLAHLDEYHRKEGTPIGEAAQRSALGDLAKAQAELTAGSAPEVQALVNSTKAISELVVMFADDDMDNIALRADEACRAAEVADPGSAWMQVCHAAVIIDYHKLDQELTCQSDQYESAEDWLIKAQEQEPDLAAVYYYRALLMYLNVRGCHIALTGEIDFEAQCDEWRRLFVALRQGGWAPLFLHAYFEEKFTRCSLFEPETKSVPKGPHHPIRLSYMDSSCRSHLLCGPNRSRA